MNSPRWWYLLETDGLAGAAEHVEDLVAGPGWRLERIVSRGQVSADWYDQEQDEWVTVIAGRARLLVAGLPERAMSPGDAVLLPAHCRHRVTWTDPDQATVWLALLTDPPEQSSVDR